MHVNCAVVTVNENTWEQFSKTLENQVLFICRLTQCRCADGVDSGGGRYQRPGQKEVTYGLCLLGSQACEDSLQL